MYNYNMMKKLRQKMNKPVSVEWFNGFIAGGLVGAGFLTFLYIELMYILPWLYELTNG